LVHWYLYMVINKFNRADTGKDDLDDNHKAVTDKNKSNNKNVEK
jgi:hypothetical protein